VAPVAGLPRWGIGLGAFGAAIAPLKAIQMRPSSNFCTFILNRLKSPLFRVFSALQWEALNPHSPHDHEKIQNWTPSDRRYQKEDFPDH
jgi:hypothetical protein